MNGGNCIDLKKSIEEKVPCNNQPHETPSIKIKYNGTVVECPFLL